MNKPNFQAPRTEPLFRVIASRLQAVRNCQDKARPNPEWEAKHSEAIEQIVRDFMPSGSGWDCGTKLDFERSTPDRLCFTGSFHHMDEHGGYDGWTEHNVFVVPSLTSDFALRITGRDRNDVKENLHELFDYALSQRIYQEGSEPFTYKLKREE